MKAPPLITGYDLVSQVLDHPQGGVQALVKLAGGETEWLEFKAAMVGRPKDRTNPKENDSDGHWNVAEAVIALANTDGGAVLLGVDDDGTAVGLESGDPRRVIEKRGMDAFLRQEVRQKIQPADGTPPRWRTGVKGVWELERPLTTDRFSTEIHELEDKTIAVIRVKPVPAAGECLIALHNGDERLILRSRGDIGQCFTERGRRRIAEVEATRHPESPDYERLWQRFLRQAAGTEDPAHALEAAIEHWHGIIQERCAELLTTFTPLDAEERFAEECEEAVVPRELFEPQAEELLPDYLRDDDFSGSGIDIDSDEHAEDEDDDRLLSTGGNGESLRPPQCGGLFGLLTEEPRAIVLGEPGSGKTTSLKRLALDDTLAYEPGGRVSLFVPLANWQQAGGLWSLIRRTTGFTPGQVEKLIRAGRCRLLLDALNECADPLRSAAVNEISDLLNTYPEVPIVLSARNADTTQRFGLPCFIIGAMSREQRRTFLRAYLGDPAKADALLDQIETQPGGESLAANPLLLRMIVEVARNNRELPVGRALLYRQWIGDWLVREKDKASRAGDPLPWTKETMRQGLAAIAFAARRQGLRIVGEDMALAALHGVIADPERFLIRLAQGLFLHRDEGHLEFRHETFQEYLAAEFWREHPQALPADEAGNRDLWGMPLAYASQIGKVPEHIEDAAWMMDPWLGAALGPSWNLPDGVRSQVSGWNAHIRKAFHHLATAAIQSQPIRAIGGLKSYSRSDAVLLTIIHSSPERKKRWQEFELSQFNGFIKSPGFQVTALRTFVFTLDEFHPEPQTIRDRLVSAASPSHAISLVKAGILRRHDFAPRLKKWVAIAAPELAAQLMHAGILTRADFETKVEDWVAKATPEQAVRWVKIGLLQPEDFGMRANEWAADASLQQARKLVDSGISTRADFEHRIAAWVEQITPKLAARCNHFKNTGHCDPAERVRELVAKASPHEASKLVSTGVLNRHDFATRAAAWVGQAVSGHLKCTTFGSLLRAQNAPPSGHVQRAQGVHSNYNSNACRPWVFASADSPGAWG